MPVSSEKENLYGLQSACWCNFQVYHSIKYIGLNEIIMAQFLNILLGGLFLGGIFSLISVGLSLQYGVARVLNIAHGEFLMFGAFITYTLQRLGINPLVTVVIVGPVLFIVGFILYRTIFTPIRIKSPNPGVFESNGMLAAFGLYFIVQNIARLIPTWGTRAHSYLYLVNPIPVDGTQFAENRVIAAAFAVAVGIVFYLFLERTRTGKAIRAAAQDASTAELMGVNINYVLAICFGFGAAMAGIAGSLISIYQSINTTMGLGYTLIAIVVVTLGGLGSIPGSFLGGFILGIIGTWVAFWKPILTVASYYVIFIIILLIRPKGLLGK
jgi:branched-chain amino acid transport system permease protein